jgi:hypothetical protein
MLDFARRDTFRRRVQPTPPRKPRRRSQLIDAWHVSKVVFVLVYRIMMCKTTKRRMCVCDHIRRSTINIVACLVATSFAHDI